VQALRVGEVKRFRWSQAPFTELRIIAGQTLLSAIETKNHFWRVILQLQMVLVFWDRVDFRQRRNRRKTRAKTVVRNAGGRGLEASLNAGPKFSEKLECPCGLPASPG